jgi:hypothetical protein
VDANRRFESAVAFAVVQRAVSDVAGHRDVGNAAWMLA